MQRYVIKHIKLCVHNRIFNNILLLPAIPLHTIWFQHIPVARIIREIADWLVLSSFIYHITTICSIFTSPLLQKKTDRILLPSALFFWLHITIFLSYTIFIAHWNWNLNIRVLLLAFFQIPLNTDSLSLPHSTPFLSYD